MTERRYLESKIKTDGVKIKHQPDGSYYDTGSCVHPLSITGIEITFGTCQFPLVSFPKRKSTMIRVEGSRR